MNRKKIKQDTLRFIGHFCLVWGLNVLCKTLKIVYSNRDVLDELKRQNKNYIVAFWHGTMLVPWYLHKNQNTVALISKSKDGDLLAKLLRKWNYTIVRGSSTEGGEVALGIMVDYAKNFKSIAVTPDGPKGPAHKLKAGAVVASKKSGVPLILLGIGIQKKKVLKSWDKFEIPMMFSCVHAVYSNPIFIEAGLSYEETSKMISHCELKLNELQDNAARF
ncbi:MAG TPA: lysophospholipid acyltransferase family protein [Ignavibacteriaceae bacterium]|nr:lysophospholipid acyltransferase family protein [Ignavibacteriaceae bacterium]